MNVFFSAFRTDALFTVLTISGMQITIPFTAFLTFSNVIKAESIPAFEAIFKLILFFLTIYITFLTFYHA